MAAMIVTPVSSRDANLTSARSLFSRGTLRDAGPSVGVALSKHASDRGVHKSCRPFYETVNNNRELAATEIMREPTGACRVTRHRFPVFCICLSMVHAVMKRVQSVCVYDGVCSTTVLDHWGP